MKVYNSTIPRKPTWWDRFRLAFVPRQVDWNASGDGLVTIYKIDRKGRIYLIHQEPIQYGDARNHQLDRLGL